VKGSPGAGVEFLQSDHEVIGSSPGKRLLQKCMKMLRT
jgi:hypothetical protein